jgi:DNA-binding transcriptional regulator/RsmH inhibitor MraZ
MAPRTILTDDHTPPVHLYATEEPATIPTQWETFLTERLGAVQRHLANPRLDANWLRLVALRLVDACYGGPTAQRQALHALHLQVMSLAGAVEAHVHCRTHHLPCDPSRVETLRRECLELVAWLRGGDLPELPVRCFAPIAPEFTGADALMLDGKGRLVWPYRFRRLTGASLVLMRAVNQHLLVVTAAQWQQMTGRHGERAGFRPFLTTAQPCTVSTAENGHRILIPHELRGWAGLRGHQEVILCGFGPAVLVSGREAHTEEMRDPHVQSRVGWLFRPDARRRGTL